MQVGGCGTGTTWQTLWWLVGELGGSPLVPHTCFALWKAKSCFRSSNSSSRWRRSLACAARSVPPGIEAPSTLMRLALCSRARDTAEVMHSDGNGDANRNESGLGIRLGEGVGIHGPGFWCTEVLVRLTIRCGLHGNRLDPVKAPGTQPEPVSHGGRHRPSAIRGFLEQCSLAAPRGSYGRLVPRVGSCTAAGLMKGHGLCADRRKPKPVHLRRPVPAILNRKPLSPLSPLRPVRGHLPRLKLYGGHTASVSVHRL